MSAGVARARPDPVRGLVVGRGAAEKFDCHTLAVRLSQAINAAESGRRAVAMTYDEMFVACMGEGRLPFDYQRRIAEEGLPELITVPTGAGKTAAVVLGWLYRRQFHPDESVRRAAPRWLVICQPMRTLVEQVVAEATTWLSRVRTDRPVRVHTFMGGEPTGPTDWRLEADNDAIVVGTQDMLLSRALNRGFGSSRFLWPVEFGALNTGCAWVFDEIQLMGAGVPTGRQLHAFRGTDRFGTLLAHSSTWMSATPDERTLNTVDNPWTGETARRVDLSRADREGPLRQRLRAEKTVQELIVSNDPKKRLRELATAIIDKHRQATLTIAVVNNVNTAQTVAELVERAKPSAEVILLHSRFRRPDRATLMDRVRQAPPETGRILISTQVIEAGVDLDAATLFTEAAPWPSVVQRLGRCNRAGTTPDAQVWWFAPEKLDKPLPYEAVDVAASIEMLRSLEGQAVVPDGLGERGPRPDPKLHPVIRSKDLLALFDTTPEVGGFDIDVSPYVRDLDDSRHLQVAWRPGLDWTSSQRRPTQNELCSVPLGKDVEQWLRENGARSFDVVERHWKPFDGRARPNQIWLVDAKAGGYSPSRGFDLALAAAVPDLPSAEPSVISEAEESTGDDSASLGERAFLSLSRHLLDAVRAAASVCEGFGIGGALRVAVVESARRHDIGKAHEVFQDTMIRCATNANAQVESMLPLAKAQGNARHRRHNFRHELASAIALLEDAASDLRDVPIDDRFLVIYLTAAHHGRVRMNLRSMPKDEEGHVFGIRDGDVVPAVRIGDHLVPGSTLHPSRLTGVGLAAADGEAEMVLPWRDRTDDLLDRFGPFSLALLEALVRFADWKASANPSAEDEEDEGASDV